MEIIKSVLLIVMMVAIFYIVMLILRKVLMGVIFIPLRQNQYVIIEAKGDESKSGSGNSNYKRIEGYSIRLEGNVVKYYIVDSLTGMTKKLNDGKDELSEHYGSFWRTFGVYPCLTPGVDKIVDYDFSWGKIANEITESADKKTTTKVLDMRTETVSTFFDSYTYGIRISRVRTLDQQHFDVFYKVPVLARNILIASYGNLPFGYWLKSFESTLFEGTQAYVGSRSSIELLKEDFRKGGTNDLIDFLLNERLINVDGVEKSIGGYLKDMGMKTGYDLVENGFSVLDFKGELSQKLIESQEADAIAKATGDAAITKAEKEAEARGHISSAEKKFRKSSLEGEFEAFMEKLPDNVKADPVLWARAWEAYQATQMKNLQVYNSSANVVKTI